MHSLRSSSDFRLFQPLYLAFRDRSEYTNYDWYHHHIIIIIIIVLGTILF